MSPEHEAVSITRKNLDKYLGELAKEFRKLNGKGQPADIILIGGAAVSENNQLIRARRLFAAR